MIYKNTRSLDAIRAVLQEVDVGIADRSMTVATSAIGPLLAANAAAGFSLAEGLAEIGCPIDSFFHTGLPRPVVVSVTMWLINSLHGKKKLRQQKELLLQELVRKQASVIRQLERELDASAERIEYLKNLNDLLQKGMRDLKTDLA